MFIFTILIFILIRSIKNGLKQKKLYAGILEQTAKLAKAKGIKNFTTSIVISPHKNFALLSSLGQKIALKYDLNYIGIDFKKKDGFLKTNQIAKSLELYRQNYCGCEFALRQMPVKHAT